MNVTPFTYYLATAVLFLCALYIAYLAYETRERVWRSLTNAVVAAFLLGLAILRLIQ